jgi:cation-transporting ATPase E
MKNMKDFLIIIRRNFTSPTVIAILMLSLILLVLNERRDALFVSSIIIINTLLAIIQETRAQMVLRKLELISAPRARRIRPSGVVEDVMFNELVVGDIVQLRLGDEAPADGEVVSSAGLEVDESILTGESVPVSKSKISTVYAASAIVAGSATMRVTDVGSSTMAGTMTATLKRYSPQLTPLQINIGRVITWLTYGALGLALLIFIVNYLAGESASQIFKTITSATVTVIPEGLLLASSLLLAWGSLKLAQAKVLPQKLAAIEAMALLDVLCIDKTGTLTSNNIQFESIELFDSTIKHIPELISIVAKETSSGSATNDAIISSFPAPEHYNILQTLAFSSERKMSGVKVVYGGKTYSVLLGAPEFIATFINLSSAQKQHIELLAGEGKRVLMVATFDDTDISLENINESSGQAVAIIILSNKLRRGVEKTVAYLQKNGVSLRVISGDSPSTVRYVANQAGIINHHKTITGAELKKVDDKDWDNLVARTTIFARILPEQKERLIETFKRLGNFTGMIGDGVNDALALKKADLGIAMYAGATATRRVADIVLLNNSFNSLPLGMKLGNQIIQSIELIATLFFHKVIYGIILVLSTLALGLAYPFNPSHITFMNFFLVTFPTVMWTLFAPFPRHRLSPRYFWHDTLLAIAPIAVLSGIMLTVTYAMLRAIHPNNLQGVSTTTAIIAILFGVYLVILVPRMFYVRNNYKTRLAHVLYVLIVLLVVVQGFGLSFIRNLFDFTTPAWQDTWPVLGVIAITAILQWIIAVNAGDRIKKRHF